MTDVPPTPEASPALPSTTSAASTPTATPQPPSQVTFTVYHGPSLETIQSIVARHFTTRDAFIDQYGIPTVHVVAEPAREKFKELLNDLAQQGLVGALRSGTTPETLTVRVFTKPQLKPSRKTINVALFFATVATVFLSGYLLWGSQDPLITSLVEPSSIIVKAATFTVGLLAIIGLHEFGHKATTNYHKLDATFPYFIPGPPPIGTFGALISLRGPPANRDQLFDLGLSGPVVGFIVTIIVTILSLVFSTTVSGSAVDQLVASGKISSFDLCLPIVGPNGLQNCEAPLLLIISSLSTLFSPLPVQGSLLFPNQELWFAAHIGALLTFLNIVPAWQLDGGHISRATFGPTGHRTATIAGLIILLVAGYWPFALLLVVMMRFTRRGFSGVEPLDDVTPLSTWRKLVYVLALAMLVLTFFPSPL